MAAVNKLIDHGRTVSPKTERASRDSIPFDIECNNSTNRGHSGKSAKMDDNKINLDGSLTGRNSTTLEELHITNSSGNLTIYPPGTTSTAILNAVIEREEFLDKVKEETRREHNLSLDSEEENHLQFMRESELNIAKLQYFANKGSLSATDALYRIAYRAALALENLSEHDAATVEQIAKKKMFWPVLEAHYDDFTKARTAYLNRISLGVNVVYDAFTKAIAGKYNLLSVATKQGAMTEYVANVISLIETIKQCFEASESVKHDRLASIRIIHRTLDNLVGLSTYHDLWRSWISLPELSLHEPSLTKWQFILRKTIPIYIKSDLEKNPELKKIGVMRGLHHVSSEGREGSIAANTRAPILRAIDRGLTRILSAPDLAKFRRQRAMRKRDGNP